MANAGTRDDQRTVDLGVRPPDAEELGEDLRTVIDDTESLDAESGVAPCPSS